ncbi:MAG: SDR family NAD(P)-dependent oxidoreductase [Bacteroidetes bacterium]|jgi:NAD(P)-dependent dehydrogenase (short-subunit alcohol dehydrogenase family)|nr:SDR family NAD(P)-dependent oxidoreductase [Bacteroidota bacterium]
MIRPQPETICITGASRGIGLALVRTFLEAGYHVAAVTRNPSGLNKERALEKLTIIEADITNDSGRQSVFTALKELPSLKILVHNAGKLVFKPFGEINADELEKVYAVNVFAPFLLTQKLLSLMDNTHTINISSIGGVEGSLKFAGLSAYSSSKAALNCLTEMLSEEFKDTGNTFNCLALGSVDTEMFRKAFPGVDAGTTPEKIAKYILSFSEEAPKVMRGKIISLSLTNP